MSQDSPDAQVPNYGTAPDTKPTANDELSAPPQMSSFARLGNVFFSPGEVFEDVRRSPRGWWLPFVALLVIGTPIQLFIQHRFNLDPVRVTDAATEAQLEKQGKSMKDLDDTQREQLEKQKQFSVMIFKALPIVGPVIGAVVLAIGAGVYYLTLMIFGGRTTYLRTISVITHANFATGLVQYVLGFVAALLTSPDDFDLKTFLLKKSLVVASPAALVSITDHPVLYSFLNFFDIFSLGYLAIAAIGLAAICVKRLKFSSALAVVAIPYVIWLVLSVGLAALTSK